MYKDVGKRILAVMLCICMLIGMGHISNMTVKAEGTLKLTLNARYGGSYNGQAQPPQVSSVTLDGVEQTEYTIAATDSYGNSMEVENITDAGTYTIKATVGLASATAEYYIAAKDLASEIKDGKISVECTDLTVGDEINIDDIVKVTDTTIGDGTVLTGISETDYLKNIQKSEPEKNKEFDYKYRIDGDTTEVGSIKVSIYGCPEGNYGASTTANTTGVEYTINVNPKAFSSVTYTDSFNYTGQAQYPTDIIVTGDNDAVLSLWDANTQSGDYELKFYRKGETGDSPVESEKIIEPGEYYFKVIGKGAYEKTESGENEFCICKSFNTGGGSDFTITYDTQVTYIGTATTPQVVIRDSNGYTLVKNVDYTVSYENNIDVGTGYIFIDGEGVYTGSLTKTFEILPISLANVAVEMETVIYNGMEQEPEYTISFNGNDITENVKTNCDVTFTNNINAGAAQMKIAPKSGNKNYTGEFSKQFVIETKSVTAEDITVYFDKPSYDYTGSVIEPKITLQYNNGMTDVPLVEGTDFKVYYGATTNATNSAKVTIEGIGNYKDTRTETYIINAVALSNSNTTITVDTSKTYTYTGRAILPDIEVVYNGKKLTKGVDYEIASTPDAVLGQNVAASESAVVQIKGIGNYCGTASTTFTIAKMDISSNLIIAALASAQVEYTGKELEPAVTITYRLSNSNIIKLVQGTDFTVSYDNNTNVSYDGKGEVKAGAIASISGINNFTGSITKDFTITPKELTDSNLSVMATNLFEEVEAIEFKDFDFNYYGEAVVPTTDYSFALSCLIGEVSQTLTSNDYKLSYVDNDKIGVAQMVITGGGNYTGTVTRSYNIKGNINNDEFNQAKINVTIADKEYTGSDITLTSDDVVITYQYRNGDVQTLEASDYEISYPGDHQNVNDGVKIQIAATDNGNYIGSRTETFKIVPKAFDAEDFMITIPDQIYKGAAFTEDEIQAAATITYNGIEVEKSNYEITFNGDNQTDCNDAVEITITATDAALNYTGSMEAAFAIVERTLTQEDFDAGNITAVVKEGNPLVLIEQENITLTREDIVLNYNKEGIVLTDEQITIAITMPEEGYTEVGAAALTIAGNGNFDGTVTIPLTIYGDLKAGLDAVDSEGNAITQITYAEENFFNEGVIEPEVVVTYRGKTLVGKAGDDAEADYEVTYSGDRTNVTAGLAEGTETPTLTITGIGNYQSKAVADPADSITRDYTILKCNMQDAYEAGQLSPIGLDAEGIIYNKNPWTPLTGLVNNGTEAGTSLSTNVFDETMFTVTYANNIEGGIGNPEENDNPPTVIITATEANPNYEGSLTAYFTIRGISFENYNVEIEGVAEEGYLYDGRPHAPEVTLYVTPKDGSEERMELILDKDYLIAYENAVNAGTAEIVITGINNFEGEEIKEFTIHPRSIDPLVNPDEFTVNVNNESYTGAQIIPEVEIIDKGIGTMTYGQRSLYMARTAMHDEGVVLTENSDYTLEAGAENLNVGTGIVNIYGTGNYTGAIDSQGFSIVKRSMADEYIVVADIETQTYQGAGVEPKPVVSVGGRTLTEDVDYTLGYENNHNVGTATVTITSINANLEGSRTLEFEIAQKNLADEDIVVFPIDNQVLKNGTAEPEPQVVYHNVVSGQDITLVEGTDYTLSYQNNTMIGVDIGTVEIHGIGNYNGTTSKTFTIAADIADAEAEEIPMQSYTGEAIEVELILTMDGQTLNKGTDYLVSYTDNVEAGTATITVKGMGNYGGTKLITFEIGRDFSELVEASGFAENYTYTGEEIQPLPGKVTMNGKVLKEGTDYTLSYSDNINVGTATVTVNGSGCYSGSKSYNFNIIRRSIAQCSVNTIGNVTYNGKSQKPTVTVTYGNTTLKSGTDYTAVYLNNERPGTARVIISGRGNYVGNKVLTFKVNMEAVNGVAGIANSSKKITLTWNKGTAVTGYEIYDMDNNRVARINGTKYSISGLDAATAYTYKVRAYTIKGGQTFYSPFTNVTVKTN